MGNLTQRLKDEAEKPMTLAQFGNMLKIVGTIVALVWSYAHVVATQTHQGMLLDGLVKRSERVERYLSSQDSHYWEKVTQEGGNQ